MSTGVQREAPMVVPMVAIDADFPECRLETAIRSSRDAGCFVMVMAADNRPAEARLYGMQGVYRHPPLRPARRGEAIRAMASAGAGLGMTHLITLDAALCCEPAIAALAQQMKAHPEAVVCAAPAPNPAAVQVRKAFARALASFWFRVQTGLRVRNSTGGFRAYPIRVLQQLRPIGRGLAFDYEMLVRAAWAETPVREVEIAAMACPGAAPARGARGLVQRLGFIVLQIHLTMRSVVPWPHRKTTGAGVQEISVSLLRPRQSLKMLLGQHLSPARLGLSAALGVFLGTLPLIACHSIATLFAAGFFRLSKVAALSAGQLCMPPLVPALCIELGYFLRHGSFLTEISLRTLGYEALDRLVEWLLGSLLLAPLLAAATGAVVYVMARQIARRTGGRGPCPDDAPAD